MENSHLCSIVSHHIYIPYTLIPFLHEFQILVESFILLIADHIKIFQEVSKMAMPKMELDVIVAIKHFVAIQFQCNSLLMHFQESYSQGKELVKNQAFFSSSDIIPMKCSSLITSRICRPTNTPALIFSIDRPGNAKMLYLKHLPSIGNALMNCFKRPSFMCKVRT